MDDDEKLQPTVTKAATNNEKSFNHFMSRVRPSTAAMTFLQQPLSVFATTVDVFGYNLLSRLPLFPQARRSGLVCSAVARCCVDDDEDCRIATSGGCRGHGERRPWGPVGGCCGHGERRPWCPAGRRTPSGRRCYSWELRVAWRSQATTEAGGFFTRAGEKKEAPWGEDAPAPSAACT